MHFFRLIVFNLGLWIFERSGPNIPLVFLLSWSYNPRDDRRGRPVGSGEMQTLEPNCLLTVSGRSYHRRSRIRTSGRFPGAVRKGIKTGIRL